jgi:hypothetical protein
MLGYLEATKFLNSGLFCNGSIKFLVNASPILQLFFLAYAITSSTT